MASNVPGPLEARRRLGKRKMTALNSFDMGPALPPWELSRVVDLTQWQWMPPGKRTEVSTTQWTALTDWLKRRWPGPEAQLAEGIQEDTIFEQGDKAARNSSCELSGEFMAKLDDYMATHGSMTQKIAMVQLNQLTAELERILTLGLLSKQEVRRSYALLHYVAQKRDPLQKHVMRLYKRVLSGIQACTALDPTQYGHRFWNMFMSDVLASGGTRNIRPLLRSTFSMLRQDFAAGLSRTVIQALANSSSQNHLTTPDISVLREHFTTAEWQNSTCFSVLADIRAAVEKGDRRLAETKLMEAYRAHWTSVAAVWQAEKIMLRGQGLTKSVSAISVIDSCRSTHRRQLVEATNQVLEGKDRWPAEDWDERISRWVFVLARLPKVGQHVLLKMAVQSAEYRIHPWSCGELCLLALAHWGSRDYLSDLKDRFHSSPFLDDGTRLASLAVAIWESGGHRELLLASLWQFVKAFGKKDEFLRSFQALAELQDVPESRAFFEALAHASQDLHLAIEVKCLWDRLFGPRTNVVWRSVFWNQYAAAMISALGNHLSFEQCEAALGLHRFRISTMRMRDMHHLRELPLPAQRMDSQQAKLIIKYAVLVSEDFSISDRQALKCVMAARKYLRHHGQDASCDLMLRIMFHVVTREMERGEVGRAKRLQWFFRALARRHGDATARALADEFQVRRRVLRVQRDQKEAEEGWMKEYLLEGETSFWKQQV